MAQDIKLKHHWITGVREVFVTFTLLNKRRKSVQLVTYFSHQASIIIVGNRVLFDPYHFLRYLCIPSWISLLHFFEFCSSIFFKWKVHQPFGQSPTCRTRSLYSCSPITGWPNYTIKRWIPSYYDICDCQTSTRDTTTITIMTKKMMILIIIVIITLWMQ
jgi:hypothetical protein